MSENADLVRDMARKSTHVSCATLSHKKGTPFISTLLMATDCMGRPVIQSSNLSKHTQNFKADPQVSILVQALPEKNTDQDFPRATLMGKISPLEDEIPISRYLRRYPRSRDYMDFGDFNFYIVEIEKIYLVGGFASVANISADQYYDPPHLAEIEEGAISHMNEDHRDALKRYGEKYLDIIADDWEITGLDIRGMDLSRNGQIYRVNFPEMVTRAGDLRHILANM